MGTFAGPAALGIDHNDRRATPPGVCDSCRLRKPGTGRIVPPKHDRIGVIMVWNTDPTAKREGVCVVLVPATDLHGINKVWATEYANKTFDPLKAIHHRRSARRRDRERNRFCTIPVPDLTESPSDGFKRLFPFDFHPSC